MLQILQANAGVNELSCVRAVDKHTGFKWTGVYGSPDTNEPKSYYKYNPVSKKLIFVSNLKMAECDLPEKFEKQTDYWNHYVFQVPMELYDGKTKPILRFSLDRKTEVDFVISGPPYADWDKIRSKTPALKCKSSEEAKVTVYSSISASLQQIAEFKSDTSCRKQASELIENDPNIADKLRKTCLNIDDLRVKSTAQKAISSILEIHRELKIDTGNPGGATR